MPTPRRVLGEIDGNRGFGKQLSPNSRAQIEGARKVGGSWGEIATTFDIEKSTAQYTISQAPKRSKSATLLRKGAPETYSQRTERKILRIIRRNPKWTYARVSKEYGLGVSRSTIQRLCARFGIKK